MVIKTVKIHLKDKKGTYVIELGYNSSKYIIKNDSLYEKHKFCLPKFLGKIKYITSVGEN